MTIFVTSNRCLWFYKEQWIGKSIIVLRPLWDIVINSECDFGIKHSKLNSVIQLENTVFGRQTFSKKHKLWELWQGPWQWFISVKFAMHPWHPWTWAYSMDPIHEQPPWRTSEFNHTFPLKIASIVQNFIPSITSRLILEIIPCNSEKKYSKSGSGAIYHDKTEPYPKSK